MSRSGARAFDVVVVGAGLVGAAVARELAGARLSVALLDARADVGDGTSKANTAILHTGFDATPGTLESRLVARGYELLSDYARATGIPVEPVGATLVAWDDEQLAVLPALRDKAVRNGYTGCELVGADAVYAALPALGPGALGGLTVPGESVTCTWTTNLALATDAVARGATLLLRHEVTAVSVDDEGTTLGTSRGDVRARWVVNAAGLGADVLDRRFGHDRFRVVPRRGELLVYDKLARPLAPRIVLPVPSKVGKGVLVSPTVYGNVMLGPTSEDLDDRLATGTTQAGLDFLLGHGRRIMPALLAEEVTASYAGLRAAVSVDGAIAGDYLVDLDGDRRYLLLGGIRSTGLTASLALAEHAAGLLADAGLDVAPRDGLPERAVLIARDPEYGRVVCFCERVTAGELRDACASPLPPADLDGLRRRTRAMNGRCQGFWCGAEVTGRLAAALARTGPAAGETP